MNVSAYKNIGSIKVHACTVTFVGVHIVFIRLFVIIIVWNSCVKKRLKKLTFRSPRITMLEDISFAFFNGPFAEKKNKEKYSTTV